jgi:hypothetical protein
MKLFVSETGIVLYADNFEDAAVLVDAFASEYLPAEKFIRKENSKCISLSIPFTDRAGAAPDVRHRKDCGIADCPFCRE